MTRTWPGQWGDVTRRGHVVVIDGTRIVGTSTTAPEPLLFLRADEGPHGLVVVGQGHDSGHAHCWTYQRGWTDLGPTHGANCVETDGELVWWQTSATTYERLSLTTGAHVYATVPTDPTGTSQGFLDCTVPQLLWTDTARVVDGLVLPQAAGAWLVGQHPTADAILCQAGGVPLRVIQRPGLFEPRAALVGGELVVVVRATDGIVVVGPVDPATLPQWTEPEPPVPQPPTQPPTGGLMLATIRQVRAKYGATMTDDECVEICNEVAWIHRAEGYGVSRKEQGTRGTRHDGQQCCHDVVMLRDGRYWDILGAAGGASVPQWQDTPSGVITDPARGWIAPIAPLGQPPPVEPPTSDLDARVTALETWARQLAYRG